MTIHFNEKTNPEFTNEYPAAFIIDEETFSNVVEYLEYAHENESWDDEYWLHNMPNYMFKGMMAKFAQNPDLKEKLLATADDTDFVFDPPSEDNEIVGKTLVRARTDLRYHPMSTAFYHLKLDMKDTGGTEAERYKRMEGVFSDVQNWLWENNKYAYPVISYSDYHTMRFESCIMTAKPMVGEPWDREPDGNERPRLKDSITEMFKDTATSIEFEYCYRGFYAKLSDYAFKSENKNLVIYATRPHPDEFGQYCVRVMHGLEEHPKDENGEPAVPLYGVFDFDRKPFLSETSGEVDGQ